MKQNYIYIYNKFINFINFNFLKRKNWWKKIIMSKNNNNLIIVTGSVKQSGAQILIKVASTYPTRVWAPAGYHRKIL